MKHKILGVAALLCAMLFAACSDLLEDLTPKETSSVESGTMDESEVADTDLYVHVLEISGDFTLESEQSGTELRFTALDTEPGSNLVWKVYKGDEALTGSDYTQSSTGTAFSFDTSTLESGNYTLFVTSGTRSATAVFTIPSIYSTGLVGDIVLSDWKYITAANYTKYKNTVSERGETPVGVVYESGMMLTAPTSEKMTWSELESNYGSNPTVNGLSGWHIPTTQEIRPVLYNVKTIVSESIEAAGLTSLSNSCWTSTPSYYSSTLHCWYNFVNNSSFAEATSSFTFNVLLVRICN